MGLLSRRRKPTAAVITAAGPVPVTDSATLAGPDPEAAVTERDVIRVADLHDAPGWTTLPPPAPLLPPMPFVVSQHFEDDLVAWQAPDLALAPLGHAISTTAPAGVVEAIAVLSPDPMVETPADGAAPAGSDPALPLVTPVGAPPEAAPPETLPSRSARSSALPSSPLPSPATSRTTGTAPTSRAPAQPLPPRPTADPRPSPPARPTTAPGPAASGPITDLPLASTSPTPPVAPTQPAPEGGDTGLVGDAPLPAGLAVAPPAEPPNPLLEVSSPPELPLVQLPAARLPAAEAWPAPATPEGRTPQRAPATPAAGVAAPDTLTGSPRPSAAPLGPDAPSPPAVSLPAAGLVGERGLFPTADRTAGDDVTTDVTTDRGEVEVPLPLVDRPGPQEEPRAAAELPPPGSPSAPTPLGAPAEPGTPLPPVAGEHATPTAPLLGDTPPLAVGPADGTETVETTGMVPDSLPVAKRSDAESQPPPPPPLPPRRTGLGKPLEGLPPTAARFDPMAVASRMSMGDMIRARTDRKASPGRPVPGRRDPGRRDTAPAPPGSPAQGAGLPLAPGSTIPRPGAPTGQAGPTGQALAGTVSDSGYPAPRPLPLVPIERMGPTIAGTAPDAVAPADAVGPLASLRQSLLEPVPPAAHPQPSPPPTAEGAATRASVGQRHGLDLSQVPVDRSAASAARARSLGARGFTSPSAVVIPAEAGTLNAGPGQALLAHELTHVAQRARRGPNLPAENTPEGQVLEAEARSAELALAPSAPVRAAGAENPPRHPAPPAAPDQGTVPLPLAAAPGSRSGDTVSEATLMAAMQKLSQMGTATPPGGGPATVVMTPASVAPPAPTPAAAVQRASVAELAGRFGQASQAPPASGPETSQFSTKPSDADLSKLARWLYPLISFRIRGELRENRERAGLLTDTYRRW